MSRGDSVAVKARISRLTREIDDILRDFYGGGEKDLVLRAGMLERQRDDVVRGIGLQLHTAIEDVLTSLITYRILDVSPQDRSRKMRSKAAEALREVLAGPRAMDFAMKINRRVAVGLLRTPTRNKLIELNTLRNKCSHNWILGIKVRRKKKPKATKPPLLYFRGRDVHGVTVLKDFVAEYSAVYLRLLAREAG
jgi:hypothetical protein